MLSLGGDLVAWCEDVDCFVSVALRAPKPLRFGGGKTWTSPEMHGVPTSAGPPQPMAVATNGSYIAISQFRTGGGGFPLAYSVTVFDHDGSAVQSWAYGDEMSDCAESMSAILLMDGERVIFPVGHEIKSVSVKQPTDFRTMAVVSPAMSPSSAVVRANGGVDVLSMPCEHAIVDGTKPKKLVWASYDSVGKLERSVNVEAGASCELLGPALLLRNDKSGRSINRIVGNTLEPLPIEGAPVSIASDGTSAVFVNGAVEVRRPPDVAAHLP